MIDTANLTIEKAGKSLRAGEFSVTDLVSAFVLEAQKRNPEINAYLEIFSDTREDISRAQNLFAEGRATALTGIPIAVKDNILIKGRKASAASKILENYQASYDAAVIKKLKAAGAVIIGRTNMDEFAMGSSTENSAFGPTKNPLDGTRVPGGSSGGAAAAVVMGGALGALGSDTGGSIRQPAAFCGLVGLLPTYGSVSRSGLIAMASSLDQIGPLARTVSDAEIIFDAIADFDPSENTSVPLEKRNIPLKNLKEKKIIGVPRDFIKDLKGGDSAASFQAATAKLEAAGFQVVDVNLSLLSYALPAYYIIMPAEASTNLARFDGLRYGGRRNQTEEIKAGEDLLATYMKNRSFFGSEVKRRIILGTFVLSAGYRDAYYNKASLLREGIKREMREVLEKVDAICLPTTPTAAFKIGEKKDPLAMYLSDIFTVGANIANLPALAVPFGHGESGLPLSVSFIGPSFSEKRLFALGRLLEEN